MIPDNGQENEHGRLAGGLGPLFSGLIAATLIALTLLAAVAMGMGEQQMLAQVEPSPTATPTPLRATPVPSATSTDTPLPSSTFTPTSPPIVAEAGTPTLEPTLEGMPTARPTVCVKNRLYNWDYTYTVKAGNTLWAIADAAGTTITNLLLANCLGSNYRISPGDVLYVPRPVVLVTSTPRPTTVPAPVIETFRLDPTGQVIVGECVQIDWAVRGIVNSITLSARTGTAATETLVRDGANTGGYSDCPTKIGTRVYTLTAKGPDRSSQMTRSIPVVDESVPPTVSSFWGTPLSGVEPLEVSFAAKYTGIVTEFLWSFGDGGTSTAQNPTHTYATAGNYTVSLTVTGPGGSDTETKNSYIHVDEPTPTPTPSLTPTPSNTPTPSVTPTPSSTPTPTNTPVPPTPTNTPVPPTPTNTPVPPTNTPTDTPEPEAASPRETAFLLDAFRSWAAVSLPQAHLPAV